MKPTKGEYADMIVGPSPDSDEVVIRIGGQVGFLSADDALALGRSMIDAAHIASPVLVNSKKTHELGIIRGMNERNEPVLVLCANDERIPLNLEVASDFLRNLTAAIELLKECLGEGQTKQ